MATKGKEQQIFIIHCLPFYTCLLFPKGKSLGSYVEPLYLRAEQHLPPEDGIPVRADTGRVTSLLPSDPTYGRGLHS